MLLWRQAEGRLSPSPWAASLVCRGKFCFKVGKLRQQVSKTVSVQHWVTRVTGQGGPSAITRGMRWVRVIAGRCTHYNGGGEMMLENAGRERDPQEQHGKGCAEWDFQLGLALGS